MNTRYSVCCVILFLLLVSPNLLAEKTFEEGDIITFTGPVELDSLLQSVERIQFEVRLIVTYPGKKQEDLSFKRNFNVRDRTNGSFKSDAIKLRYTVPKRGSYYSWRIFVRFGYKKEGSNIITYDAPEYVSERLFNPDKIQPYWIKGFGSGIGSNYSGPHGYFN